MKWLLCPRRFWRPGEKLASLCIVAAAAVAAIVPLPQAVVERWYSTGVYPMLQQPDDVDVESACRSRWRTSRLVAAIAAWLVIAVIQLRRAGRHRIGTALLHIGGRSVVAVAAIYLAFLGMWGLNYRRVPLERKLGFDAGALTAAAARSATLVAVSRMNALHAQAHATGWPPSDRIDPSLTRALADVARDLGASGSTVPGRPKHTLLNLYFRPAAVDGATDPFFLETLRGRASSFRSNVRSSSRTSGAISPDLPTRAKRTSSDG